MEGDSAMKFCEQRGGLSESLHTEVELQPTYAALAAHLRHVWRDSPLLAHLRSKPLTISQEGAEDPRTPQWGTTYAVLLGGDAVGFTNERPCVSADRSVRIDFHIDQQAGDLSMYAKLVGSDVSIRLEELHPGYPYLTDLLRTLEQLEEVDES